MTPLYRIYVMLDNGEPVMGFVWTRDRKAGIARAKLDCLRFQVDWTYITAEPIAEG